MNQINPPEGKTKEIQVVAGLKVVETEYRVKAPVFEEVVVKVPVFQDEPIKVPVGFEQIVNAIALDLSAALLKQVETLLKDQLSKAIDERISTIRVPKIVEELVIKTKEVEVERPIYKDVEVERPKFVDREVVNPVLVDKPVTNAVIADKLVTNAIVKDIQLTNAIIKDVEVERAVIREKIVDVIHPRYLDLKGEPVS